MNNNNNNNNQFNITNYNNINNNLKTTSELQSFSNNNNNKLIVLYFTASWCGPCETIKEFVFEKITTYTHSYFSIIDVDNEDYQDLCDDFSINAMPTFIFYKNSVEIDKVIGADKEKINNLLLTHN
jgi:thioredoxin 1